MPEPVPTTAHEQYQELLPTLEHMRSAAESALQQAIARAGIPCVVTARVKAEASAAEKLVRKPEYRTFNDLTDLVGLRIITLFAAIQPPVTCHARHLSPSHCPAGNVDVKLFTKICNHVCDRDSFTFGGMHARRKKP